MDLNKILGVVLAGGKSQRFGQDKSQVKLQDKLLIDYILSEIINDFHEILIVANEPIKYFYENIDIDKSKLFFIKNKNTRHNIFGLWSLELIEQLENDLLKGERKVEVWADSIGVKTVNIDYKKTDPFFNINTKEDLKKAIKILEND